MTHKKNTDANEELKHKQQSEEKAPTGAEMSDTPAPSDAGEPASAETVQVPVVTAESVKAEMMDRLLRLQADFDNYRRRTRQEQGELGAFVTQNLIKELLPVVDNFERALTSRPTEDPYGFGAGVEMIFRQLLGVLEKQGISVVGTVGEMFDPAKHEAILTAEDSDLPEGTVVEELQKGYAVNGKTLRPALVKVAGK
jgi:molecular chaperone GrpE